MAKIVTITNPLTGQPAQVDQLDHTAQQIDDGLNIARGVSNPNLLDNWYFGNPVNQRGQTSYTGAGMTVDRWKLEGSGSITIQDDGILIQKTSGADYVAFTFLFEKSRIKETDTLTISALVNGICVQKSGTIQTGFEASGFTNNGADRVQAYYTSALPNVYVVRFVIVSDSALLQAVKLELGAQQTLAHKDENGVWVLNEIPDYGEQLARCQWYFERKRLGNYRPAGNGYIASSTTAYIYIDCATKRADPSVSVTSGSYQIIYNGTFVDVQYSDAQTTPDGVVLEFSGNFGAVNVPCSLVAIQYPQIDIIAEL